MAETNKKAKSRKITKDTCFVIMPFGGWFDTYYEDIYKPAISKADLDAERSDDLYRPTQIIQDIWNCTKKAKVLLADLTGKNPNVFYELGLAHALKKPVVLVTESIDNVPFDLRSLRHIIYDKNEPDWGNTLKKGITAAIKEVIEAPSESILQTFVDLEKKHGDKKRTLPLKRQVKALQNQVEALSRRNMEFGRPAQEIGPDEANILIQRYLQQNMPKGVIIRRLHSMGAPISWIENTLNRIEHGKGDKSS